MARFAKRLSVGLIVGSLLLALVFVANALCLCIAFRPQFYDVREGEIAKETIFAPRDSIDPIATDALRQQARAAVEPVLKVDNAVIEKQLAALDVILNGFDGFLADCRQIWDDNAIMMSETQYKNTSQWRTMLSTTELSEKLTEHGLDGYLTTVGAYSILDALLPTGQVRTPSENPDTAAFFKSLRDGMQKVMQSGVKGETLSSAADEVRNNLPPSIHISIRMELVPSLCSTCIVPTLVEDLQKTEQARVKAASAIEPIKIKSGQIIVESGKPITEENIAILTSLDMLAGDRSSLASVISIVLYELCIFAVLWLYLVVFERATLTTIRTMLSIAITMMLSSALVLLFTFAESRIAPVLLAPLLIASLHDKHTATAMNVANGLTTALMVSCTEGSYLNTQALIWAACSIVSGQTAIILRQRDTRRSGILLAGLVGGAIGALIPVARHIAMGSPFIEAFFDYGLSFSGALISTVIVLGLAVLYELIFDIPTNARLNELLNINHPLLKKLMVNAPGTYHHCTMAAQLAQNAADSVGANALLCKVGAIYHDVGKLRRPHMFAENLNGGHNPHDELPPMESARIITAHQADAEPLLQKYHLPRSVIQIVKEHHGNTLVAYFYHKALKNSSHKLSQDDFRYDAPRPSTIESAIVMMADSCEAAVRSMGSPSYDDVRKMTHNVIRGKMDDGQFDLCDITIGQLARIEDSFVNTFAGIMHDRISYKEL